MAKTREQAARLGKALLKRMKGKGWRLSVWENLGWWYCVRNAPLVVHPVDVLKGPEKFFCMVSGDVRVAGGGLSVWTDNFYSVDPNKAVRHAVKLARVYTDGLIRCVEKAEAIVKGK